MAFQNYQPIMGFLKSKWVGLANFKHMLLLPEVGQLTVTDVYETNVYGEIGVELADLRVPVEALEKALRAAYYLADDGLATASYLGLALGKPLLLEGEPGTGKTALAEGLAEALGLAQPLTEGAAVASDAFFPFPDGIEALATAGARAVIQPGGSMRDAEVIAAADRLGLAMVFTGQRHFRH